VEPDARLSDGRVIGIDKDGALYVGVAFLRKSADSVTTKAGETIPIVVTDYEWTALVEKG